MKLDELKSTFVAEREMVLKECITLSILPSATSNKSSELSCYIAFRTGKTKWMVGTSGCRDIRPKLMESFSLFCSTHFNTIQTADILNEPSIHLTSYKCNQFWLIWAITLYHQSSEAWIRETSPGRSNCNLTVLSLSGSLSTLNNYIWPSILTQTGRMMVNLVEVREREIFGISGSRWYRGTFWGTYVYEPTN